MDKITSYATLQSAVAGMIHRGSDTSITDNLPLFIQLCEAELHDEMLMRETEIESTLTLTIDQNYVALPATYVSPIALWLIVGSERVMLDLVLPQQLPYATESAQPTQYAIDGENIRFDFPALSAYSARFRHQATDALSVSNTTNQMLLKRPDVYLYGTLKQVAIFTKDDGLLQKAVPLYESGKRATKAAENRARGRVPLRTDLPTHARSNILMG